MPHLMPSISYYRPTTLSSAFTLVKDLPEPRRYLMGGTDVVVDLKRRVHQPDQPNGPLSLIDLKHIEDLADTIDVRDDEISIGSRASLREVEQSAVIRESIPMLAEAARCVGSVQTRNRATIAGNLCSAVPSADLAPPLLAADASVRLVSPAGSRQVRLSDFFIGPRRTALLPDEIVTEIAIPSPAPTSAYMRFTPRGALDLAFVGCAVSLDLDGERCVDCRIGLGAVAPTPIRARPAEEILRGERLTLKRVLIAAESAASTAQPITDVRASAAFRRTIVKVLVKRAVSNAILRSTGLRLDDRST